MKLHLGYLLGLSAIIVAACAAFFSVYGLSQLFAGASLAVIVMATALEVSKVIAASFLHRYWDEMSKVLRIYLTIGVVVLVTITSAGIYGFLTNAYQKTANSLMVHEGEVGLIEGKIAIFKRKIENNEGLRESKNKRVSQLSQLRSVQEVRLDSMINRRYFANANDTRKEIEQANKEIQTLQNEVDLIVADNNKLNDSINKYEIQKLEMISSSDVAAEVGPLKYMAELTGKPMDEIVNYFILLLIFVFDPMAVSLVIATGWVFQRERAKANKPKEEPKQEEPLDYNEESSKEIDEKWFSDDEPDLEGKELTEEEKAEIDKRLEESKRQFVEEIVRIVDKQQGTMNPEVQSEIMERVDEDKKVEEEALVKEEPKVEEKKEEPKPVAKPKVPLKEEDIPEVKNRQKKFSVEIPKANNSVERIGSQKYLQNKNTVVYRNKRNDK